MPVRPRPIRSTRSRVSSSNHPRTYGTIILVVIAVVVLAVLVLPAYLRRETTETVVLSKERVCESSTGTGNNRSGGECKYLIFTEDGTFRVTDSIVAGRFTSSDAYGRIKVCHRYRLEHYGFRFGLTSSYPNLTEAEDLGKAEGCEP